MVPLDRTHIVSSTLNCKIFSLHQVQSKETHFSWPGRMLPNSNFSLNLWMTWLGAVHLLLLWDLLQPWLRPIRFQHECIDKTAAGFIDIVDGPCRKLLCLIVPAIRRCKQQPQICALHTAVFRRSHIYISICRFSLKEGWFNYGFVYRIIFQRHNRLDYSKSRGRTCGTVQRRLIREASSLSFGEVLALVWLTHHH